MSGPVRDIDKFEMACNVLGEVPNNATIKVSPGDTVTYADYAVGKIFANFPLMFLL